MYTVEFYETADGKSELWDFLEELRLKSATIVYSISFIKITSLFCSTNFAKNPKKLLDAKLRKPKSNVLTT